MADVHTRQIECMMVGMDSQDSWGITMTNWTAYLVALQIVTAGLGLRHLIVRLGVSG